MKTSVTPPFANSWKNPRQRFNVLPISLLRFTSLTFWVIKVNREIKVEKARFFFVNKNI